MTVHTLERSPASRLNLLPWRYGCEYGCCREGVEAHQGSSLVASLTLASISLMLSTAFFAYGR